MMTIWRVHSTENSDSRMAGLWPAGRTGLPLVGPKKEPMAVMKMEKLGFPPVIKHGWLENPQTEWRFLARKIIDFHGPWLPARHV